jgi:subtilisin family serine protease
MTSLSKRNASAGEAGESLSADTPEHRHAMWPIAVVAAGVLASGLTPVLRNEQADAAVVAGAARATTTFTLITGDRVTETAAGVVSVAPGTGRAKMRFAINRSKKGTYVIPLDAAPLIGSGRVDKRLFDLETLGRAGYDDRTTTELPILMQSDGAGTTRAAAVRARATVARDLPGLKITAMRADAGARARLWKSFEAGSMAGVSRIWLNGKRLLTDDVSNPQIGAPTAWAQGLNGKDVPVAVLDGGVDATHPDLSGRIAESKNFTADPSTDDLDGHGTHVATTIAGTGAMSNGRYRGVADGARLIIGKVCRLDGCAESDVLAGMQWAAERSKVINMSLGGPDTPGVDPLEKAVNDLTAQYGSLFVIAAGNDGPSGSGDGNVGSPGTADEALTVGAVDAQDRTAVFSSRGPRIGDAASKPDIAAPGVSIVAGRAAHADTPDGPMAGYTVMSGTSMAAPHVAGVAAILTQLHPEWSPARRKQALMGSASWQPGTRVFEQGAGRVDAAAAIKQEITVDGGSLGFGRQLWPHSHDKPITKKVTYRNSSAKPVPLTLSLQPARPGFTLADNELTVPAGGSATTTLTADTRTGPDGVLDGRLLATGPDGTTVTTPYAVDKEAESYTVTMKFRNRDGTLPDVAFAAVLGLDNTVGRFDVITTGTVQYRLPRGAYGLTGYVYQGTATDTEADDESTMLAGARMLVNRTMTVHVDARKARPVKLTVPPKDAVQLFGTVNAHWPGHTDVLVAQGKTYAGHLGSARTVQGYITTVGGTFARPGDNSPYLYELLYVVPGKMPDGFARAPRDKDLAAISSSYSSAVPGSTGGRTLAGTVDGFGGWFNVSGTARFDMPFHRTEYVTAAKGLGWKTIVYAESATGANELEAPRRTYPAGQVTRESWHVEAPGAG